MKVGFAGRWNPLDRTAWSGIYYYAFHAIKKHYPVETFFYKWPWHVRERIIFQKQLQKLINKKAAVEFLTDYATYFSKQLEKELIKRKVDLLFVPSAPQLIAHCKTDIPIVYMTDATFAQLQGYYSFFSNIAKYNIRQGIELDKKAFNNATHCMVASDWAKQSALLDYKIPERKLSVALFGANLETVSESVFNKKGKNKICRLLFIGVEWERKGGAIALETFDKLHQRGIPVHLTIIGCWPPSAIINKYMTVIPFLNKNDKADAEKLINIYLRTDFLLLPTRAECAGIVFCESAAFGVPAITTNTGGVSSYVQDGVNGYALPLNTGGSEYAEIISCLFNDENAYHKLSQSSRKKYEEELNWDTWGKTFNTVAENILNR